MKRNVLEWVLAATRMVASIAAVAAFWPATACGDAEGNVIVPAASSNDGGGTCTAGSCGEAAVMPSRECSTNAQCGSAKPLCEPRTGACVECLGAGDCDSPGKPMCNQTTHACAECITNGDCTDPREQCAAPLNRCAAPCASDNDCQRDDPHCDLAIGFCVGCRAVSDCIDPTRPYCVEGDCVSCATGQC